MPRVRINRSGVWIASPGHSVDENDRYLTFSSNSLALPIWLKGTVPISGGGVDTGAPSPFNNQYRRMTISLGKTFASPPICFFIAKWNYDNSAFLPTRASVRTVLQSGTQTAAFEPVFAEITTTQISFWNIYAAIQSISYLVLETSLQ